MENHNHNSRSGELKNLKIAVAIPTKNRLDDLIRAIESVKKQTCQPHELIIVDQSVTGIARAHIDDLLRDYPDIKLKYILNQGLTGLTAAKNLAIRSSASDILLFIDDDIILDENFLWEITRVYERYPELDGVGGVVTAPSHKTSALRRRIAVFFQVGPFRDHRALLQAGYFKNREIVKTWWLSGGLSSMRRYVFERVVFNEGLKGASFVEDYDFHSKASRHFQFALAPKARALHNVSPINRDNLQSFFEAKCAAFFYIFSNYIAKTFLNRLAFFWRNLGFLADATVTSIANKTQAPIRGLFSGWRKGMFNEH